MGHTYRDATLKILFGSAPFCAYPGCGEPAVFVDSDGTKKIVLQIAHIRSEKPAGPRYDPTFPLDLIDKHGNLLLLCGKHHPVVDANESTYTTTELLKWKQTAEAQEPGYGPNQLEEILRQALAAFTGPTPQVGQGPAGNERAFNDAYRAAGGETVLGRPISQVYAEGPGWVQDFAGPSGSGAFVLCALYSSPAIAVTVDVWHALLTAADRDSGRLAAVGYPDAEAAGAPLIDARTEAVELHGGTWGSGRLARKDGGTWRWEPQLAFDFMTREGDRWNSFGTPPPALRLRVAVRANLPGPERHITPASRARLSSSLSGSALPQEIARLAARHGLPGSDPVWAMATGPDYRNDDSFAAYRTRISGDEGAPAIEAVLRIHPDHGHTMISTVDLLVDYPTVPAAADVPMCATHDPEARINARELIEYFTAALDAAVNVLSRAIDVDPRSTRYAGAPRIELHLQDQRALPDAIGNAGPPNLSELLDLSAFGEPTRDHLARMCIGITTALDIAPDEAQALIRTALVRMARAFGYPNADDDALASERTPAADPTDHAATHVD